MPVIASGGAGELEHLVAGAARGRRRGAVRVDLPLRPLHRRRGQGPPRRGGGPGTPADATGSGRRVSERSSDGRPRAAARCSTRCARSRAAPSCWRWPAARGRRAGRRRRARPAARADAPRARRGGRSEARRSRASSRARSDSGASAPARERHRCTSASAPPCRVGRRAHRRRRAARRVLPRAGRAARGAPGHVEEDLARRDFTVNAIARHARRSAHRGETAAAEHALEDLAAGRLRVLHERSFLDDPTRLLRLARYRARLGFELERGTARAGRRSARRRRAGHCLPRACRRRAAPGARRTRSPRRRWRSMSALGVLAAAAPAAALRRASSRAAALALLPADGRPDLLLMASLLLRAVDGRLTSDRRARRCTSCSTAGVHRRRARTRSMRSALARRALVERRWPSPPGPRSCTRRCSRTRSRRSRSPARSAARLGVEAHAARRGRAWLARLRHVRLLITGDDLLAAGVPAGPRSARGWRPRSRASSTASSPTDARRSCAPRLRGRRMSAQTRLRSDRSPAASCVRASRRGRALFTARAEGNLSSVGGERSTHRRAREPARQLGRGSWCADSSARSPCAGHVGLLQCSAAGERWRARHRR